VHADEWECAIHLKERGVHADKLECGMCLKERGAHSFELLSLRVNCEALGLSAHAFSNKRSFNLQLEARRKRGQL
jgi:hypothetical protein